jgi:hypothetical protein
MDMVSYVYDLREAGARAFLKWKMPQVEDEDLEQFLADRHAGPVPDAKQALLAISLLHEALPRDIEERSEEAAYRVKVLSNVKNIATALNIYLSDFDAFPVALTGEDLREILRDYLKTDSVFCLPDSDEVVVQYLIPPGTRPVSEDIPDPGVTPMVVVEGVRGWDLVGFVDGHAQAYPKEAADAWRKYLLPPKE